MMSSNVSPSDGSKIQLNFGGDRHYRQNDNQLKKQAIQNHPNLVRMDSSRVYVRDVLARREDYGSRSQSKIHTGAPPQAVHTSLDSPGHLPGLGQETDSVRVSKYPYSEMDSNINSTHLPQMDSTKGFSAISSSRLPISDQRNFQRQTVAVANVSSYHSHRFPNRQQTEVSNGQRQRSMPPNVRKGGVSGSGFSQKSILQSTADPLIDYRQYAEEDIAYEKTDDCTENLYHALPIRIQHEHPDYSAEHNRVIVKELKQNVIPHQQHLERYSADLADANQVNSRYSRQASVRSGRVAPIPVSTGGKILPMGERVVGGSKRRVQSESVNDMFGRSHNRSVREREGNNKPSRHVGQNRYHHLNSEGANLQPVIPCGKAKRIENISNNNNNYSYRDDSGNGYEEDQYDRTFCPSKNSNEVLRNEVPRYKYDKNVAGQKNDYFFDDGNGRRCNPKVENNVRGVQRKPPPFMRDNRLYSEDGDNNAAGYYYEDENWIPKNDFSKITKYSDSTRQRNPSVCRDTSHPPEVSLFKKTSPFDGEAPPMRTRNFSPSCKNGRNGSLRLMNGRDFTGAKSIEDDHVQETEMSNGGIMGPFENQLSNSSVDDGCHSRSLTQPTQGSFGSPPLTQMGNRVTNENKIQNKIKHGRRYSRDHFTRQVGYSSWESGNPVDISSDLDSDCPSLSTNQKTAEELQSLKEIIVYLQNENSKLQNVIVQMAIENREAKLPIHPPQVAPLRFSSLPIGSNRSAPKISTALSNLSTDEIKDFKDSREILASNLPDASASVLSKRSENSFQITSSKPTQRLSSRSSLNRSNGDVILEDQMRSTDRKRFSKAVDSDGEEISFKKFNSNEIKYNYKNPVNNIDEDLTGHQNEKIENNRINIKNKNIFVKDKNGCHIISESSEPTFGNENNKTVLQDDRSKNSRMNPDVEICIATGVDRNHVSPEKRFGQNPQLQNRRIEEEVKEEVRDEDGPTWHLEQALNMIAERTQVHKSGSLIHPSGENENRYDDNNKNNDFLEHENEDNKNGPTDKTESHNNINNNIINNNNNNNPLRNKTEKISPHLASNNQLFKMNTSFDSVDQKRLVSPKALRNNESALRDNEKRGDNDKERRDQISNSRMENERVSNRSGRDTDRSIMDQYMSRYSSTEFYCQSNSAEQVDSRRDDKDCQNATAEDRIDQSDRQDKSQRQDVKQKQNENLNEEVVDRLGFLSSYLVDSERDSHKSLRNVNRRRNDSIDFKDSSITFGNHINIDTKTYNDSEDAFRKRNNNNLMIKKSNNDNKENISPTKNTVNSSRVENERVKKLRLSPPNIKQNRELNSESPSDIIKSKLINNSKNQNHVSENSQSLSSVLDNKIRNNNNEKTRDVIFNNNNKLEGTSQFGRPTVPPLGLHDGAVGRGQWLTGGGTQGETYGDYE